MGRLFIQLQGVVPELDFKNSEEREEFLAYLSDTLYERMRQALLTWRANKANKDKARAEQEKQRAKQPVPDYTQRERDRAAARSRTT